MVRRIAPKNPLLVSEAKRSGSHIPFMPFISLLMIGATSESFTHDDLAWNGKPTNTPIHMNRRVIPPRGRAVTISVNEPEAQHEQNAIPKPNKSPPKPKPTLIG